MRIRPPANLALRAIDALVSVFYLTYVFVDETKTGLSISRLLVLLPIAVLILFVYERFRLYAAIWRFASIPDLANLLVAALSIAVGFAGLMILSRNASVELVRSIEVWLVLFAFLAVPRIIYKVFRDFRSMGVVGTIQRRGNTIVIGFVEDASHFASGMLAPNGERLVVAGILSPKASNLNRVVQGVAVLGLPGDLRTVVQRLSDHGSPVETIILASPARLPFEDVLAVNVAARALGLRVFSFDDTDTRAPGSGIRPTLLRTFKPEHVLMRPMRLADERILVSFIEGKTFIVTGGGGSIGSALVEALVRYNAARVVVVDSSEGNIAALLTSGRVPRNARNLSCMIGDIVDRGDLDRIIREVRPDAVIHAAALKHVDLVETNILPAVRSNVLGTINVADACREHGVKTCVFVSTDKAVEPVSVLGMTKRLGELYFNALANENGGSHFCSVRFGNVLGSAGSALPVFLKQIELGGPISLTSNDMIRYFMTAEEARDLILAVAEGAPRHPDLSVFVLDIGKPIRIRTLVEQLIQLHGLRPEIDIDIELTGLRPGEKLFETLFFADEEQCQTDIPNVIGVRRTAIDRTRIDSGIARLHLLAKAGDGEGLHSELVKLLGIGLPRTMSPPPSDAKQMTGGDMLDTRRSL